VSTLWAGQPGLDFRQGEERDYFSLRYRFHVGSGTHPALYTMGAESKATGAWSWPLIM